MSSDVITKRAVDGVLHVLGEYQVPEQNRLEAAKHVVDALRNVMSVSDAQRVQDEIRSRRR